MKKLLCYLGIILFLGLAILPPMLRIFLPAKGEAKKDEVVERVVLACSNDKFITNTSYLGKEIQMILIKKIKQSDDSFSDTSDLNLAFSDLKTQGVVVYTETSDGEVIQIDFSVSNHDKLNIKNLTKNISEQKNYYEQQGLTCIIRK